MRGKFIVIFSAIVVIVGVLAFALLRLALGDLVANPERARGDAARSASAAVAQLELEGLTLQNWLSEQANDAPAREPFLRGSEAARYDEATAQADRLFGAASSRFRALAPSLVAFVDDRGMSLGRNGGNLLRGDNLGAIYPPMLTAIRKGATGSDVWVNKGRNEQMLVSYTAVRDPKSNVIVGGILVGTPLDDGRMSRISEVTTGRPVAFVVAGPSGGALVAKSSNLPASIATALTQEPATRAAVAAATANQPQLLQGTPPSYLAAAVGLGGYGTGPRAAIVGVAPTSLVENINAEIAPPVAVATLLGLLLVVVAAVLLSAYIARPVVELENGLLAIINGQTDRRFEIEHAELGGLAFGINSLLNHLMGVPEDNTDEEGRPSQSPSAERFGEALSVNPQPLAAPSGDEDGAVARLRAEPESVYYARLFHEYIQAKKTIGDPVEHISEAAFHERIRASEAEAAERQGQPVRYRVELKGREVTLIAVPMG